MAIGFSKANKPLNPRGSDESPKGFNRAEIYSGKALDFDGVNDNVDLDGFTMAGNVATIVFQAKFSNDQYLLDIDTQRFVIRNTAADGFSVFNSTAWTSYGDTLRDEVGFYAVVSNGTTQRVYFNGHQLGDDETITALDWDSATKVKIASNNTGTNNFLDGQIAGFKIFNTALTAAQVADLYNNPEKVVPTGVADSALKLWLPMQEGAGTTAYDGSADLADYVTNGDFSDGTNNWTASNATLSVENGELKITSTGGNRPQGHQTITGLTIGRKYLLSAVARVGTTSYNMEIEISGIPAIGSYNKTSNSTDTYIYTEFTATSTTHIVQAKIDDGAVGVGETGYFDDIKLLDLGNYGTISGATWTHGIGAPVAQTSVIDWNKWYLDHTNEVLIPQGLTSGRDLLGNLFEYPRKQGALNLDGNSWAEVHDNASLDFGTGEFSLEAWVVKNYVNSGSSLNVIMSLGDNVAGANNTGLTVNSTNVAFKYGGYQTHNVTTGDWVHVVGVYDETNAILYVDGVEEKTTARTAINITNALTKYIGRDSTTTRNYHDQIAQPRIYNRALDADEVERNFNANRSLYL